MKTRPLFLPSLLVYAAFSILILLGSDFVAFQVLGMLTWPYPFLLCLQQVIKPDVSSWPVALAFGAVAIAAVAWVIPQPRASISGWAATGIAAILDAGVLFTITVLAYVVALSMGWPIGE
jgi:hypothetical protein